MSSRKFARALVGAALLAAGLASASTSASAQAQETPARSAPAAQPAAAAAPAPAKEWTILIYGAADNNADGPIFGFLDDVRGAVGDDPALNLVLFIDRARAFSSAKQPGGEDFTGGRLYELHEKTADRLDGGEEFPEMKLDAEFEPDSADPATLRKFLRFGKARYPARRTALIIYSHADGITMCPDVESEREMGIAELTDATEDCDAVDVTALELCNMGGIEIAYQWRPGNGGFSTEVLVAIPNAGPPLDWDRIFSRIHAPGSAAAKGRKECIDPAQLDARAFGRLAVEEGGKGRQEMAAKSDEMRERAAHESVAAYDLEAVEPVKRAVDAFAVALWKGDTKATLCRLRGASPDAMAMQYARDEVAERPYFDLPDLLKRAAGCEQLDAGSREEARRALASMHDFMLASFGMQAYAGFEPGANGVFIVFPVPDAKAALPGTPRPWGRFGWYSPQPWKMRKNNLGNLAWCRDGAVEGDGTVENWFELLQCWFAGADGDGPNVNAWRW